MKRETIAIADTYAPVKRRATLDQRRADEIAASMLDKGLQTPILGRPDGARFVLVEGLHRLEAAKALGEKTIMASLSTRGNTNARHLLFALVDAAKSAAKLLHYLS